MSRKNNKKGVELSLNTIIIAIIVIIVLVVVLALFLFGFKGLSDKIKVVFFGTTAGFDKTLALQTCANRCDQASLWPKNTRLDSPYCSSFYMDENNDGVAEKEGDVFVSYYCYKGTNINTGNPRFLNVECTVPAESGETLDEACKLKN
ncbi:hypothetical protein J4409_03430 [Candidatus Woesearchaeota archaeon]|nr:hypothetical protein [Candidatus Woesearchaeota archaeon]